MPLLLKVILIAKYVNPLFWMDVVATSHSSHMSTGNQHRLSIPSVVFLYRQSSFPTQRQNHQYITDEDEESYQKSHHS